MTLKERLILLLLVWCCVYATVVTISYVFQWLDSDWPLYAEILVSTVISVSVINFAAAPNVQRLIAKARGESEAELKMDQAREAEGPDPEDT